MPSSFSQFFRKNSGDSPAKPLGNEDLECGHVSSVSQTPTASGHQLSPSRVYLPQAQSNHASMVPQTPVISREYFSHMQYNGQPGSAAQVPLTPSGPLKVVGYLPRSICSGFSPLVGTRGDIAPFQPSQNASNGDFVSSHDLAQRRSTSVPNTASHRSLSPRSPFDSDKHGQALRKLETHGSFKTIPSGQLEGDALNRTSFSPIEMIWASYGEDRAAGLGDSLLQRSESQTSADPDATANQQSEPDHSSLSTRCLPSHVYQPAMLSQGDSSKVVNLSDPPKIEGEQSPRETLPSFVFPLPNAEADNSNQMIQQANQSQVPPKPYQALSSVSYPGKSIAKGASPDLRSKNSSFEEWPADNAVGAIVPNLAFQGSEQAEDTSIHEVEGEETRQSPIGRPIPTSVHQAHTCVQSPTFEIDEYLWSPAPSVDDQEAPSATHAPSDALLASPVSEAPLDSHGAFSRSSISYGNEHIYSHSGSSGNQRVIDSPLPHIDVLIPAANIDLDSHSDFLSSSHHASTRGSRESSSVLFRYTGVVTDGASSRPMSDIELKDEVLHSLEDRAKSGLSMLNSRESNSQASYHTGTELIRGEYEPNVQPEAFPLERIHYLSSDAGPGSSQTSSSLNTDRYAGGPSSHKAPVGNGGFVSSRTRCGTPPLLFGKHAISEPELSYNALRLGMCSTSRHFNQNEKASGQKETGRLPRALYSLGEQDWETISGETNADRNFNTQTGSSVADTSDSGNLSLSKGAPRPFHRGKSHPLVQHPMHPRHNQSFMLIKNSQTGDLIQVPQYEYPSAGRLPNNNASGQSVSRVYADSTCTYQHPPPLPVEHRHPFTSSPPIIRFTNPSATSMEDSCMVTQQNHLDSKSSSSESLETSEGVQKLKEKHGHNRLYRTTQDAYRVFNPAVDQNQYIMDSKEQSHQSSAWLSTVSEVASSKPSLPENRGTSTNMFVWDENGQVNQNPKQRGNREVGSSLADASSAGANFSSSPLPLTSSPIQYSDSPPSLRQGFHKEAVRYGLESGSQNLLGHFHKSLARSFNSEDSATSTKNTEDRSRSHSASGPRIMNNLKPSPRRRRSSSESHSRLVDSSSAQKVSALNMSSSDGRTQQTSGSRLLLRNPFLHSDDNDSRYQSNQHNVIERRGRQPTPNEASIDDPITPSSSETRPFVRNGVVHTDVATPILVHPVYGRDRPWNRIRPGQPRPRPHADPWGRPLFQRPVARAESPHLHRVQRPPTPELLERQVLVSRIYLMLSMLIPPVALIYGHGYMDAVMQFHTAGELNGFCNTEKTIALYWGYGVSALSLVVIVIAMIIISASG